MMFTEEILQELVISYANVKNVTGLPRIFPKSTNLGKCMNSKSTSLLHMVSVTKTPKHVMSGNYSDQTLLNCRRKVVRQREHQFTSPGSRYCRTFSF